jgi:hypothetical protein
MSEMDVNQQQKPQAEALADSSGGDQSQKISGGADQVTTYLGEIKIYPLRRMPQFDNGSSLAFAASDDNNVNKRIVAIVADKGQLPRWSSADNYENLADSSLLRLIKHGVVYWPSSGDQKYAFIYDAAVGESILPAGGLPNLTWRQTEVNDYLIEPMAQILKIMTDRGFPHGSIRPSNIFYNVNNKNHPVILGDCLSVFPHSSQLPLFMSVEKAAAEPFGRGNGVIGDDLYAFGVSLALILRKYDELAGLSDYEILMKKIEYGSYNAIIGTERLQAKYVELLRGLLCDDPSLRWTIEDVFLWLDGTRMTPPASPRRKKANRPFTFRGHKYLFPDSLALDMARNVNDAQKVLENGDLEQWIDKAFSDKELSDNFAGAIDRGRSGTLSGQESVDITITNVVLALNPMLPIFYKDRVFTYDGIGGLMARTCSEGGDLSTFANALQNNMLDLAASLKTISQSEVLSMVKSFDVCRAILRQKKRGNSIEKCIYHLCRAAPCFSPQFKDYFVYGAGTCLRSFESLSAKGGQIALFMDQHCTAYFSIHEKKLIEPVTYDLDQSGKNNQIAGNLRFLAALQRKSRIQSLPAIAKVFMESLSGVYQVYNNIKLREQIIESVRKECEKGSLVGMSALIDNQTARQRDGRAFQLAKREFKMLQYEYDQYNRKLANKSTYGVVNGHEAASLISWVIASIITLLCVFAYVSGNRFF